MSLFGKSLQEKVDAALETLRARFPHAQISAEVSDKVVTLRGQAESIAVKSQIMAAFNELVETDNTINQISIPKAPDAPAAATPAAPAVAAAAPATTRIHDVVSGDTLSKIAKHYYGDANKYMKIFDANKDILKDPNKINVGQKLKIPE